MDWARSKTHALGIPHTIIRRLRRLDRLDEEKTFPAGISDIIYGAYQIQDSGPPYPWRGSFSGEKRRLENEIWCLMNIYCLAQRSQDLSCGSCACVCLSADVVRDGLRSWPLLRGRCPGLLCAAPRDLAGMQPMAHCGSVGGPGKDVGDCHAVLVAQRLARNIG